MSDSEDTAFDNETNITLVEAIQQGIERADLDAHLACLALTYTFHDLHRTPFARSIQVLQAMDFSQYENTRMRPHDVAVAGVRLALDWRAGQARQNFEQWCQVELGRRPLPQLDTIATDPRLLVGVVTGTIQVESCHSYKQALWSVAESFRAASNVSPWQYILACWAHRLLAEGDHYNSVSTDLSRYLARLKGNLSSRDCAITIWVLSHFNLFTPTVSTDDLVKLRELEHDLRQMSRRERRSFDPADVLEISFIYDSLVGGSLSSTDHYYHPVHAVLRVIEVFDRAATRLEKERRKNKQRYTIEDEYDVQDLFYAMLLPELPDLEPEDPTSKNAGSSKKIDFISRRARIGIELKHVGDSTEARKISDALKIDIESYHIHPACQTLISFVYDPHRCITNAPILERDLSGSRHFNGKPMEIITRIRPH